MKETCGVNVLGLLCRGWSGHTYLPATARGWGQLWPSSRRSKCRPDSAASRQLGREPSITGSASTSVFQGQGVGCIGSAAGCGPGAAPVDSGGGSVHDHLRGGGRAGIGAVELAELPLASQHPQRVVDPRLQTILQVGVPGC